MKASDKDSGSNGAVKYSLSQPVEDSSTKLFEVNAQTGVITLKASLDREDIEERILYVKAEDGGSPKLAGLFCILARASRENLRLLQHVAPVLYFTFHITAICRNSDLASI